MAEGIVTPDGRPVDVEAAKAGAEREFAAAMAAPAGEDKAPPKRAARKVPEPPSDEKPRVDRKPRGRPPKSATAAPSAAQSLSRDERVTAIQGLMQVGAGLCLVAEKATHIRAFRADAITIASAANEAAVAVADTCEHDEKLARIIDRVCAAGPYAALVSVGLSIGTQLARNHGANLPGTQDPEELLKLAEQQEPMAA